MSRTNSGPDNTNSASGLPMLPGGSTGTDIAGNPRGLSYEREDPWLEQEESSSFGDDLFDWSSSDW
jgi:hypothetical protein